VTDIPDDRPDDATEEPEDTEEPLVTEPFELHVGGRVEPVGLEVEMQRSYLDYAMSVIVGRALPDVRDGLKPVHRKILYAMYDSGYRPDRGYVKCSRVVGDVMGQFHPHGDASIYDALVRMAQPWSLRYPLVDGNGNFGSPGNDPPAAMRYCVTGETRVRTPDGTVRIDEIVPDAPADSEHEIDLKVLDRNGDRVTASRLFHSGMHPTFRLRTREGYELTGTGNHPVLCLVDLAGIPTLLWKLLEEIAPDDRVVLQRVIQDEFGTPALEAVEAAIVAGAFVSEGWASSISGGAGRAGFNNTDAEFFTGFWPPTTRQSAVRATSTTGSSPPAAGSTRSTSRTSPPCGTACWPNSSTSAARTSPCRPSSGPASRRYAELSCGRSSRATARRRCCRATPSRFRTRPAAAGWLARCSSCCWSSAW